MVGDAQLILGVVAVSAGMILAATGIVLFSVQNQVNLNPVCLSRKAEASK
ncbi:hypothetical protein IB286_01685 [Spongiibacter sp. KMU-158]|uniref:Uncharacterized protein n=1 Tax=Spongiibacter pelagi TaxID=2760804 RepID=A0A927BY48_9GAMM|nr:hypothetical protein [Spongiibacter pelagi]MBD2857700.1 hypothetical protein [Spongiibacter pelagi]